MNLIIESHVNTIQKRVQNIEKRVLIENDCANLKRSFSNIMDVSPHEHFFETEMFLKVKKISKSKFFLCSNGVKKRFWKNAD